MLPLQLFEHLKKLHASYTLAQSWVIVSADLANSIENIKTFYTWLSCPMQCGTCKQCILLANGCHPDFLHVINNSIDDIREINHFCNSLPQYGTSKVVVLEVQEQLNLNASNALLKVFEEPQANTLIFILTPNLNSLLPTIISRAQVFQFPSEISSTAAATITSTELWEVLIANNIVRQDKISAWLKGRAHEVLYCIQESLVVLLRDCLQQQSKKPTISTETLWMVYEQVVSLQRYMQRGHNLNLQLSLEKVLRI